MDNMRAFEDEVDFAAAGEDEPAIEAPPEIGVDERRMHVRAYNYWVSLLEGRPYPSIKDLDPGNIDDFGPNSVLLDFSRSTENPDVAYIGKALREECSLGSDIRQISDVPKRSLLSRLTDHYLQIIANCAPIGFEAEFQGQRGVNTMYRGILMPFSSDGDSIDFIYGVINWKELLDNASTAEIGRQVDRALAASHPAEASPVWADGPNAEPLPELPRGEDAAEFDLPEPQLPLDAGLADRLCVARDLAEAAKSADGRSRSALYRALGQAYDFAVAAEAYPEDYAEILEDSGLKAQERAPMTPIVKLVFGIDYDKTRLTEFAAALDWGRRQNLPIGAMRDYIESFEGGLKGMVAAERRARRPQTFYDAGEAARIVLRTAEPVAFAPADGGTEEFVVMIARREPDGSLAVLAPAIADKALLDRAIRKSGR